MNQIHNENIITMTTPDSANWVFSNSSGIDVANSLSITPTGSTNIATRNVAGFDVSYNNLTIHVKGRVSNFSNAPFHDITINVPGVGNRIFTINGLQPGEVREVFLNHSFDVVLIDTDFDLEFTQSYLPGINNSLEIDEIKVSQSEVTSKIRTYFLMGDIFEQAKPFKTGRINISEYKIGGVDQLTNEYVNDQLSLPGSVPGVEWGYSKCNVDSSVCGISEQYDGFNPFFDESLIDFNEVNGQKRGRGISSVNGKDYGTGIFNIGVDRQSIFDANGNQRQGAFFIDIDYTKSFDMVINTFVSRGGNAYVGAIYSRKFSIKWNEKSCERSFLDVDISDDNPITTNIEFLGFLNGNLTENQSSQYKIEDLCNGYILPNDLCPYKERTLSYATRIILPELAPEDKGHKECCFENIVLAHLTETDDYKNDYSGFYHQKQLTTETVKFTITDNNTFTEEIVDDSFGVFKSNYIDNPFLETFVLDWKKVLIANGSGYYIVEKEVIIAGITIVIPLGGFKLNHFTNQSADKTIRIDSVMNGLLVSENVDFSNTSFQTSLRIKGFFGRRSVNFVEDNLVDSNYRKQQISIKQENEYKLQTGSIAECLTTHIFDYLLLSNELFMNDYNIINHSYKFRKFSVTYGGNEGDGYSNKSRKAILNLTFNKRNINAIKRNY